MLGEDADGVLQALCEQRNRGVTHEPAFALWLTGLPASGKSTLARGLAKSLRERGHAVQILDSDELRSVLTPDPTYTEEERDWFHQVVAFIGRLLTQNGVTVLIAATANRRRFRLYAREEIEHFLEVYVKCPLEICMERDQKGIYRKALAGEASTVPGLQVPYEPPENPAVVVNTGELPPEEAVLRVLGTLEEFGVVAR